VSAPLHIIAGIRDDPADDLPRLACADWYEEDGDLERAEFIRAQLARSRLPAGDPRRDALAAREEELLQKNSRRWLGPLAGLVAEEQFERGFVSRVVVRSNRQALDFVRAAAGLFAQAPVTHLELRLEGAPLHRETLARLAGLPEAGWLRALTVRCNPAPPRFATPS
jgi:uncharacterized protein (TIGR02996 family)